MVRSPWADHKRVQSQLWRHLLKHMFLLICISVGGKIDDYNKNQKYGSNVIKSGQEFSERPKPLVGGASKEFMACAGKIGHRFSPFIGKWDLETKQASNRAYPTRRLSAGDNRWRLM